MRAYLTLTVQGRPVLAPAFAHGGNHDRWRMVVVACFAASTAGGLIAMMAARGWRTISAASAGRRSKWFSPNGARSRAGGGPRRSGPGQGRFETGVHTANGWAVNEGSIPNHRHGRLVARDERSDATARQARITNCRFPMPIAFAPSPNAIGIAATKENITTNERKVAYLAELAVVPELGR